MSDCGAILMSSSNESVDLPDALSVVAKTVPVYVISIIMLLSSLTIISDGASSDPVSITNPDDTREVLWEFDDPGDYTLTDTEVAGGEAHLEFMNETDGDGSASEYSNGTSTGLDFSSLPGSAIVDRGSMSQLVMQPGTEGVDAYISESKINDNYGNSLDMILDSEVNKRMHILMWFNLSSIPANSAVANATLWLYELPNSKGADVVFDVHMLTQSFVESEVTWAKYTTASMWATPGGDFEPYSFGTYTVTNLQGWVGIDLSRMVERWVTGADVNNGLILVPATNGGDNQKVFQSSDDTLPMEQRPRLAINYSVEGGVGVLESRPLGPGTNATFTLVTHSDSVVSHLDDGFSGTTLSSKWTWMNNPVLGGGGYDVGTTRPGWLHVTGSGNTQVQDTILSCNYLYQHVTGHFTATTYLQDYFTVNSMGAGMLLYEGVQDWIYIGKMDPGSSGRVQVVLCENGTSATVGTLSWTGFSSAHLKIVRDGSGIGLYASTDGETYSLAYLYEPYKDMLQRLRLGLFTFSTSTTRPVVDFDRFTVAPVDEPAFDLRTRIGNSTTMTDPSWEDWGSCEALTGPAVLGETGRYLQYRAYMSTSADWYTPLFSGLDCWYELYAESGMIQTEDYIPTDFSVWYAMTTSEFSAGGSIGYWYSTDHGGTWTYAGTGGSYSIMSTEQSLMVRISIETYDTLSTPKVYSVSAVHGTAVAYLLVSAPDEVVAGEPFPITIYAKDGSDVTMIHWSGPVTLTAMEIDGATPTETALAIPSVTIISGGYVTVPNQMYTEASTILIRATAQDAYGFSAQITVTHAAAERLRITPAAGTLLEGAYQTYYVEALDTFDNLVDGLDYNWSVDAGVGTLSRDTGEYVTLRAGDGGNEGYLRVSGDGLEASLFISVVHEAHVPTFSEPVPDQTKYEDSGSWTIDLAPYVQDSVHLDSELRWYVTNETIVDVSGENRTGNMIMTISTIQDLFGTDVLTLHVSDPEGLEESVDFTVTILPVNDWPIIGVVDPLVVHWDVLYVYNMKYYVKDVDDSEGELSLSVGEDSAPYVAADKLTLYILYPKALNGTTHTVVVTVSDGAARASTVVQITVSDDNVPVIVDYLPDIEMYQGETAVDVFCLDDFFFDPDNEVLYYAYGFDHVMVNISDDNLVTFLAPTDWYGTETVIFSAIDPQGARVESSSTVTVHRVNQAPVIDGVPDLVVKYDLRYEFDLSRYVSDPDDDMDDLYVTTDDTHVVAAGLVLTVEYPVTAYGQTVKVEIVVSDGELSDSCMIDITVGNNAPPTVISLPIHSFQEDLPVSYPSNGNLADIFEDAEGEQLSFEVFIQSEMVDAVAVQDIDGDWTVTFVTAANWHGTSWFVIRATDPGGALVEATTELTVHSVPDAPVLSFSETVRAPTGTQTVLDLRDSTTDPDEHSQGMVYTVSGEYRQYATIIEGVLVLDFPESFLGGDEESRTISISICATDPDGLHDTEALYITVVRTEDGRSSWLMAGMVAMAAVSAGSFIVAMRLRKRPFVIKDLMLVHNDGFLIGRAAEKQEGEIDEDVLSGMLTAVLNFVEDSMAKSHDGLRSFGFDRYKVMVKRGRMTYIAVVYEGDAPETAEERLETFLAKVEKIYRKRIESWTGDMDTDFAGVEVLLRSFVKENSRKANSLNGGLGDSSARTKTKAT